MRYFLLKTRSVCHLRPGELTHTGRKHDIHIAFCNVGKLWMDACRHLLCPLMLSLLSCFAYLATFHTLPPSQILCSLLQYDQALPLRFHAGVWPAAPSHGSSLQ